MQDSCLRWPPTPAATRPPWTPALAEALAAAAACRTAAGAGRSQQLPGTASLQELSSSLQDSCYLFVCGLQLAGQLLLVCMLTSVRVCELCGPRIACEMLRLKFSHLQAVARHQQQQRACECVVEAAALDVCTGSALTHLPGAVVIFISRVYALCCSFVCAAQACTLSRHACRFFPVCTTRSGVVRGGRFLCSFVREGVFCCTVFPHVRLSLAPRLLVHLC